MEEPLARALDAVRSYVVGKEPLSDTLLIVAENAVAAMGADMAGLTLEFPDGRPRTAVSTAEVASEVDQAQYDADRGPCLDSYRQQRRFVVLDTAAETRWPEFAEAAQQKGVRSSVSLPLIVDGNGIGALNLYSTRTEQFSDDDADHADIYAGQAAVALVNAQAYWEQADLAQQLEAAMRSRATIEQAKGVIMATTGCSADEAFAMLRLQSQHENRKLRELAEEVVQRQRRPDADGG